MILYLFIVVPFFKMQLKKEQEEYEKWKKEQEEDNLFD